MEHNRRQQTNKDRYLTQRTSGTGLQFEPSTGTEEVLDAITNLKLPGPEGRKIFLSELELQLLQARVGGKSLETVASELGKTRDKVSQMEARIFRKIRYYVGKD
jgi:DNA-directed RNA polymerase sigma subunit (sigma70/sigma32)